MAKTLPRRGEPIMPTNLIWASEVCGNGKTCPRISSVTPWGTRIVVGKKVTNPELLTEIGGVAWTAPELRCCATTMLAGSGTGGPRRAPTQAAGLLAGTRRGPQRSRSPSGGANIPSTTDRRG